jgi:hypothetical protein
MAKKSGGPSKSDAIRKYQAAHEDAGPKGIAEALSKDGIKVSAAFVSTVLSNDRKRAGKRRRRKGSRKPGPAKGGLMAKLVQAKSLVREMGGIKQAQEALDALAKLLD